MAGVRCSSRHPPPEKLQNPGGSRRGKAVLEIKALQSVSGLRSIATALTEERVREAEALFQRMEGKSRPLSFDVNFALANYREPEKQKTIAEGVTE